MKKSIVRIICFLLILTGILWKTNQILSFKFVDGNRMMYDFYQLEENTLDAVIIGSSHAYVNFNNGTLWDEFGIASYNLGASVQPMWNSYHYLKEVLKTQKPEMLILEGFGVGFDYEYSDDSRIIKSTYGLNWSPNKIEALEVSTPENRFLDFLLDYTHYHTRYASLNRGDFIMDADYVDSNGYQYNSGLMGQFLFDTANTYEFQDVSCVTEPEELYEKAEKYYRKILELAKENDIQTAVIIAPFCSAKKNQGKFLRAQEIAEEYGAGFLNGNLFIDEIGLDFSKDYHDSSHMTVDGSQKFSRFVGQYLKENFNISDRRGDQNYSAWDNCASLTRQFQQNEILKNTKNINDLPDLLMNASYRLYITADGSADMSDAVLGRFLKQIGVSEEIPSAMWVVENQSVIWESGMDSAEEFWSTPFHDFCMKRTVSESGKNINRIIVDNERYRNAKNGINVVVYDKQFDRVVDSFGIDLKDKYRIVR